MILFENIANHLELKFNLRTSKNKHVKYSIKFWLAVFCVFFVYNSYSNAGSKKVNEKKNILLIIVDDLRTELGCYGKQNVITPNIDNLAAEGILFSHAYCQKSICVPSRHSFLTGMRPNTFGSGFSNHFRDKFPDLITLPQLFKKNGYKTISVGKVFHHRDPVSWDIASWVPEPELCYPIYVSEKNKQIQKDNINANKHAHKGHEWWAKGGMWVPADISESPNVADDELFDGKIANYAIEKFNIDCQ